MKTTLIYFFILIGIIVSFNSCCSDDEPTTVQTFLEKYDGTIWFSTDVDSYIKLNNSTTKAMETWYDEGSCYEYSLFSFKIIEDLNDRLILSYEDGEIGGTLTLSIESDRLKVVDQYTYNGDSGTESYYFDKTNVNVDSFEICN